MIDYRGLEWAEKLLTMADAANVPQENPAPHWQSHLDFQLADGWKMSIFYDAGELDYINHFVSPSGEVVDFWEWPDLVGVGQDADKNALIGWRGTR